MSFTPLLFGFIMTGIYLPSLKFITNNIQTMNTKLPAAIIETFDLNANNAIVSKITKSHKIDKNNVRKVENINTKRNPTRNTLVKLPLQLN